MKVEERFEIRVHHQDSQVTGQGLRGTAKNLTAASHTLKTHLTGEIVVRGIAQPPEEAHRTGFVMEEMCKKEILEIFEQERQEGRGRIQVFDQEVEENLKVAGEMGIKSQAEEVRGTIQAFDQEVEENLKVAGEMGIKPRAEEVRETIQVFDQEVEENLKAGGEMGIKPRAE